LFLIKEDKLKGELSKIKENYSNDLFELLKSMLKINQEERAGFFDIEKMLTNLLGESYRQ